MPGDPARRSDSLTGDKGQRTKDEMDRYGFDDLRRFAAALGTACGVAPLRALAMASHLLWFDAAGAATLGIASLPTWLEAIERGQVDPMAVGRVLGQRSALAIFDGEQGLPHLALGRAAELAVETARETAVGLVRVDHVGPIGSAGSIAAGIALGPMAGLVVGPNRLWSMGLPSEAGLPVVVDSGMAGAGKPADSPKPSASRRSGAAAAIDLLDGLRLGTEVLIPGGGWLVVAISVAAVEPLSAFHQRVAAACHGLDEAPGRLLPALWDARRREALVHGIAIALPAWKSLSQWAQRLAVEVPGPLAKKPELA
jgi:LDH2 family malate/lactate/ureidoglycolate dehydrogenase